MESLRNYPNFELNRDHTLFVVPGSEVMALVSSSIIVNWKYNRPYDHKRVQEIQERVKVTNYISDTIKLAQIGNSEQLVVYDGVHRLLSLDGSVSNVALDIMFSTTEDKVIEEFTTVNKSVPVPELYLERNIDTEVKEAIETFVYSLQTAYPLMCSSSKNCRKPNFNCDVLKDDTYDIFIELESVSIDKLIAALGVLNNMYSTDYISLIPETVRMKCEKGGGLYLFCERRTINRDKLRLAIMHRL